MAACLAVLGVPLRADMLNELNAPIDPPLLPGEVEIDVSDLEAEPRGDCRSRAEPVSDFVADSSVDPMITSRGNLRSMESRISIERMIAAARARRREQGEK
jgi:hypothetical protein